MKNSNVFLCSLLATGLSANPLQLYERALERRDVTVSTAEFNKFKLLSQYAAASYCVNNNNSTGTPIICGENACPLVESAKATSILEFSYDDLTDNTGFLALDPTNKLIVLSFRGSKSLRNWITNLLFIRASVPDICTDCSIHTGFLNAWDVAKAGIISGIATAKKEHPDYRIITTGHSLGAAVSTIAAAVLRKSGYTVDTYTYGSPRVGNFEFATYVTSQSPALGNNYRITHLDDPVPRLPPLLLGYRHTSPEYWLATGTATTTAYTIADVKTCVGVANTTCNAGTSGLDGTPHSYYFQETSACAPGFSLRRDGESEFGDNANELDMFMKLDVAYFGQMESQGLL